MGEALSVVETETETVVEVEADTLMVTGCTMLIESVLDSVTLVDHDSDSDLLNEALPDAVIEAVGVDDWVIDLDREVD